MAMVCGCHSAMPPITAEVERTTGVITSIRASTETLLPHAYNVQLYPGTS